MADPAVVLGFLDPAGDWNPALAFVMAAAVGVTSVGYRLLFRRGRPLWAERFALPTATALDARLLGGAALFGIGWGLAGYCPGPALASLAALQPGTLVFVVAMLAGMILARALPRPAPAAPGAATAAPGGPPR
jgi:uncharacterized membrane protein YedE/YeeE